MSGVDRGHHRAGQAIWALRLSPGDGVAACGRLEYAGHVWAEQPKVPAMRSIVGMAAEGYDFIEGRTHDGRKFHILTVIDEFSRECLALVVARKLNHEDVLAALAELFFWRGPPAHIRSDNGSEFIAGEVQKWLGKVGVKTLYITPGSP